IDRKFLRNLIELSAGFLRDARQYFFAVRTVFAWIPAPATTAAPHAAASVAAVASAISAAVAVAFLICQPDYIHGSIGALGRFDGAQQGFLAAVVHPVG